MRGRVACIALVLACATIVAPPARSDNHTSGPTITYVGVIRDQRDFTRLDIGNAGYWFPQFDAASPVAERPTGENARDALPDWAGPLNHATTNDPATFGTRTFSQDGPARSKGGQSSWNTLTLPDPPGSADATGETGLSGAIVDPFTRDNSNNTINRIRIGDNAPSTFYFHVVTDNTNREHDPMTRLRVRARVVALEVPLAAFPSGETNAPGDLAEVVDGYDVEPDTHPGETKDLSFNGVADVYTFRFEGFKPGDFIKLQLNGGKRSDGTPNAASFGGFMFDDESFDGSLSDADGDGLLDGDDRCPSLPSQTASGCPEAERSLTLQGGKKRFTGALSSAAPGCVEGMSVSLWKEAPTGDVPVASATTDADGHYGAHVNVGKGSYYATVSRRTAAGVADCLAARSPLLVLR